MTYHLRGLAGRMLLLNVARILPALIGFVALGFTVYEVRAAATWTDHSDQVLARSNELQRKVIDLETGLRGYSMTRDRAFLAPMVDAQAQLPDDLSQLRRLVRDNPEQTRRAREISDAIWDYELSWLQPAIRLGNAGQELAAQMWAIVGRERMETIRQRFSAFEEAERALRSTRTARVAHYEQLVVGVVIAALFTLVAVAVLSAGWLRRRVVLPLTQLRMTVDDLKAGDLTARAQPTGFAEVGELAHAFNAMADELAASRARSEELTGELERQARTDSLTGIANRRAFDELLERECANARRHGGDLSLLLLDLDDFKQVNDVHGHAAGDAVLVKVAAICAGHRRGGDLVARIGGDEFAVMLPRTPASGAETVADDLRQRIAAESIQADGATIGLRASFGLVTAAHRAEPDVLLKAADLDLYARKRGSQHSDLSTRAAA